MAVRGRMSNGFNSYNHRERDDFNSGEFKHDSGSSPHMRQNNRNENENTKLYVSNIPLAIDETGLSNIFAAECVVPTRVYISKNRKSVSSTSWGFVEYKTVSDAQTAIQAVNKKPPYELSVQFSKAPERNRSPQGSMGNQGRSQYQSREQSYNTFKTPRSNDESFTETFREREPNSPNGFLSHSPGEPITPNSKERLPSLPIEKYTHVEISDEMDLHVAAYMSNRAKNLTLEDISDLCSEIKLALPFKPGQCCYCHRTAIYTCSRCKTWYCSNFCRLTHWPQHKDNCTPRTLVFQKDGTVTYKDIPDSFCNEDFVKQNSFNGRSPRGNQGKSIGPGDGKDSVDTHNSFDNGAGHENFVDIINRRSKSPDNNRDTRDNFKGFDRGNNRGGRSNRRGGDRHGGDRQGEERRGGDRFIGERQGGERLGGERQGEERRGEERRGEERRGGERQGEERRGGDRFGGERHGAVRQGEERRGGERHGEDRQEGVRHAGNRQGGERLSGERQGRERHGGEREKQGTGWQGGGYPDKKASTNWSDAVEIEAAESQKSTGGAVRRKQQQAKVTNFDKAPVPADLFTEVSVSAIGKEGEFWAYKTDDYKKQADMMLALNEYSKQNGEANFRVEMGAKYVAPYQGDWYRAEVVKTYRDNVRVIFIDFGNESEVQKSDLKLLPENLTSEPPMAYRFILADSLNNPKLMEEFTFKIKPVMEDKPGRWLVQAEGVHYRDSNVAEV